MWKGSVEEKGAFGKGRGMSGGGGGVLATGRVARSYRPAERRGRQYKTRMVECWLTY